MICILQRKRWRPREFELGPSVKVAEQMPRVGMQVWLKSKALSTMSVGIHPGCAWPGLSGWLWNSWDHWVGFQLSEKRLLLSHKSPDLVSLTPALNQGLFTTQSPDPLMIGKWPLSRSPWKPGKTHVTGHDSWLWLMVRKLGGFGAGRPGWLLPGRAFISKVPKFSDPQSPPL